MPSGNGAMRDPFYGCSFPLRKSLKLFSIEQSSRVWKLKLLILVPSASVNDKYDILCRDLKLRSILKRKII